MLGASLLETYNDSQRAEARPLISKPACRDAKHGSNCILYSLSTGIRDHSPIYDDSGIGSLLVIAVLGLSRRLGSTVYIAVRSLYFHTNIHLDCLHICVAVRRPLCQHAPS